MVTSAPKKTRRVIRVGNIDSGTNEDWIKSGQRDVDPNNKPIEPVRKFPKRRRRR